MKIPCVRCGKPIDSPSTYCRECARDMEEGNLEHSGAPTKKKHRTSPLVLLMLLAILGGGLWYLLPGEDIETKIAALREEVPTISIVAEEPAPEQEQLPASAEQSAAETAPGQIVAEAPPSPDQQEMAPAATSETPPEVTSPNAPEAVSEAAPETTTETGPENTGETAEVQEAQEAVSETPAVQAESQPAAGESGESIEFGPAAPEEFPSNAVQEETAPAEVVADPLEQPAEASAQEQPAEPETAPEPATYDAGVWIFWMDKEGADRTLVQQLEEKGWVNAEARGEWPGHFNDKNIFYRHEDQTGLADLRQALPSDDFYDYFYNNERIGQSIKRIFRENDNVDFVIILQ